jgi:hypothetical protein
VTLNPTARTARVLLPFLLPALLLALLTVAAPATARSDTPVEDYAGYAGQKRCMPKPKPGAVALRDWSVDRYGGHAGAVSRACGPGTSEHKEGRAFDWTLDARKAADRARAQRWMDDLFATGTSGEAHELARRMGVMYIIWNDTMYASYREFEPTRYVSSSCRAKALRRCSATLRHRDHVHVSLSWPGARMRTSWYSTPAARRFR